MTRLRLMRIYLAPCGMGVGHISRCKTIANLLAEHDWSIFVSTYSDGLEYAKGLGYPLVETVPVTMKTNSDGGIDFKLTAATSPGLFRGLWSILRQIIAEMRNIQRIKPALVVSDSRASSLIAARLLRVPSIAILNQFSIKLVRRPSRGRMGILDKIFFLIANTIWFLVNPIIGGFWSFADKILIPDLPLPYTISYENLAIPRSCTQKVEFIGPLLKQIPTNPSKLVVRNHLGYDVNRPLILVPLSVPLNEESDFVEQVERVLEKLPDSLQIVMSRGRICSSAEAQRKKNITVYDWIFNLDDYLEACDMVISRAGHHTILSSLAYGKPSLVIPIPDHPEQLRNARRASQLGVAKVLSADELTVDRLVSAIDDILNTHSYAGNASAMGDLMRKMKSTEEVIEVIEQLSQRRHA